MRMVIGALLALALLALAACGGVRPAPASPAPAAPAGLAPAAGAAPAADSRYLAIVDARGDGGGKPDQLHVIDTVEHKLVLSAERSAPDGIFLPDGSAMLLGGVAERLDRIESADWKPARSLKTAFHGWWKFFPEMTQYALSPDGRRLQAVVYHPDGPAPGGIGRLAVQSVDVPGWQVLEPAIEVPPCGGRVLAPSADVVYHICMAGPLSVLDLNAGKELRRINVGPITYVGHVAHGSGGGTGGSYAGEFLRRDGKVVIIGAMGGVREVNPAEGTTRELATLDLPDGHMIPSRQAALSPDGKLLYVGTTGAGDRCSKGCTPEEFGAAMQADTVRVYDTATWQQVRSYAADRPFFSLAVTAGGRELALVSMAERTITFVAAATGKELTAIEQVGNFPSLIIGPPSPLLP